MLDPTLTEGDLRNLRVIVSRAHVNGVDEAKVLVVLANKIDALLAPPKEAPVVQDAD